MTSSVNVSGNLSLAIQVQLWTFTIANGLGAFTETRKKSLLDTRMLIVINVVVAKKFETLSAPVSRR